MPGLYEKKTDEELIQLVRSGDQDASDCLLSRYRTLKMQINVIKEHAYSSSEYEK